MASGVLEGGGRMPSEEVFSFRGNVYPARSPLHVLPQKVIRHRLIY